MALPMLPTESSVVIGRRPKNHPVIVTHEVGKAPKRSCSPNFVADQVFGAHCRRDPEGAGEVILSWKPHVPSKTKTWMRETNFMALNRRTATAKCITPKDVSTYRRGHKAPTLGRRPPSVSPTRPLAVPSHILKDDTISFGTRTEKSENVRDLITNKFAEDWIKVQLNRQNRAKQKEEQRKAVLKQPRAFMHPPKTDLHSVSLGWQETFAPTRFVMKRFKKVAGRTDTAGPRRCESAPLNADLSPTSCTSR
eukprot:Sspe_Gene.81501::Locus_52317_Transcript_1_1_Confidence_1.000_Length_959::g.81501::m.81501